MIPELLAPLLYLLSAALFILGLKKMSSPATARRGNVMSGVGMLIAIVVTLLDAAIVSFEVIAAGLVLGGVAGLWIARSVQMTAMPQLVAALNGSGGAASMMVGGGEFLRVALAGMAMPAVTTGAIQLAVLTGAVTFTGSIVAFAKLQELIGGRPIVFAGQRVVNLAIVSAIVVLSLYQVVVPEAVLWPFYMVVGLSLLLGFMVVVPIGGADMPVVIALLNSYSGVAAAMTGFAIDNHVLIIAGSIVGSAGLILTQLMCRAMNRSLANVFFGAFGSVQASTARSSEGLTTKQLTVEDAAVQLAYARLVVVVPGYGLAVAQAQHQVREFAELIEKQGGEVRYAIHPVAGRMPGHMNVLLSEANISYDRLITDVDEANAIMPRADIAIVVGANDIVNPAAIEDPGSPIFGMPIIRADTAQQVIVMKRSMASGFAGIENDLFYRDNAYMLFGDAKQTLSTLVTEIKQEVGVGV